jgi:integrase/recombinase XerC
LVLLPEHLLDASDVLREDLLDFLAQDTLRHRSCTRAYRGSRNLRAVQVLMGHSSIATTQTYLACDDQEIRAAMLAAL